MRIHKMALPNEWYPRNEKECRATIEGYIKHAAAKEYHDKLACIVPHASWYFSGELACRTIYALTKEKTKDLVILLGGHLRKEDPIVYYDYDGFETPLGNITQDNELLNKICSKISTGNKKKDAILDNSIEVILPFIKFFLPKAKIIALRVPPSNLALKLSEMIKEQIKSLSALIIASSDLTHYGPNYNLSPKDSIEEGLKWAKDNDFALIRHIVNMDGKKAILHAVNNRSACSAGAFGAAIYACADKKDVKAELIDYYTSYKISPRKSFVGYLGMIL